MTEIYLNEKYIGDADSGKDFVNKVREERRKGKLPESLNIYHNKNINEISIDLSKGRNTRPLIVVENGQSRMNDEILEKLNSNEMKWNDLISQGIVEYLDAAEEENALVALYEENISKETTHLEISPLVILGLITSLVPYANYGQSSRLNRGSKTQKQALGLYASNYLVRMDTDVNVLHYPQTPVVRSFMHNVIDYDKHPAGQNVVIALMSYEGFNMQDSIIINKASVQRGLARSTFYRPYESQELRYSGGLVDQIGIPDKDVKGYKSEEDYKYLEEDGVVYPEAKLKEEAVIIGKTSPPRFLGDLEEFSLASNIRRESSTTVKYGEDGVVELSLLMFDAKLNSS